MNRPTVSDSGTKCNQLKTELQHDVTVGVSLNSSECFPVDVDLL